MPRTTIYHPQLDEVRNSLCPIRDRLLAHKVYARLSTIEHVRTFMEHHVFAVWDFMSLLKALQLRLTCVTLPWRPQGDPLSRRLINEIVLEEESDEVGSGKYLSHFEMYRLAMEQCEADTSPVNGFLSALGRGAEVPGALAEVGAPQAAADFVRATWEVVRSGSVYSIAAAFTLGREDLIPAMFRTLIRDLKNQHPKRLTTFQDYLERHIDLDEERHGPMARHMLVKLCGDDAGRWKECEAVATAAMEARLSLWDGVCRATDLSGVAT